MKCGKKLLDGEVPAIRIHGSPIHANQVIFPSVRTLLHANPTTLATATNTAVHVP
jgi:hypothetical protein